MCKLISILGAVGLLAAGPLDPNGVAKSFAADMSAGEILAKEVCAACHGANGVSVSDDIPNLAGQKTKYLTSQLKAFKDGARKNAMMNALAAQLDAAGIDNVAAYYAALPAGSGQNTSTLLSGLSGDQVTFPGDHKKTFTRYITISFPKRKQVRHYYANQVALEAAKGDGDVFPQKSILLVEIFKSKLDGAGKPIKGDDGHFVADQLAAYTAMEKQPGWGENVPDLLRNGDWRYSVFSSDGTRKTGVNEAKCMACHKPLNTQDYVFSIDAMKGQ